MIKKTAVLRIVDSFVNLSHSRVRCRVPASLGMFRDLPNLKQGHATLGGRHLPLTVQGAWTEKESRAHPRIEYIVMQTVYSNGD